MNSFISIFFNGSISGYIQFFISIILVNCSFFGVYSFIKFIQKYKLYGLYSTLAIVIVPLLTISHMRYLLPIIPLLMFGVCWYFLRIQLTKIIKYYSYVLVFYTLEIIAFFILKKLI